MSEMYSVHAAADLSFCKLPSPQKQGKKKVRDEAKNAGEIARPGGGLLWNANSRFAGERDNACCGACGGFPAVSR